MRVLWRTIGMLAVTQGVCWAQVAPVSQQPRPAMPEAQLVREVVYNELNDHQGHGYWRYWIERHTPKETKLENQIETAQGPVTRLALTNGHPISPETQQQEGARLRRLLSSPAEQARHIRDYAEDEERIGHVVALMADAFVYRYAGEENGCYKLTFSPNPNYPAHSIEARVIHAMSGTLWVDARMKRMVRLDAQVQENLDFGFGLLGRLYKGGWFQIERTRVSATDWKTERLEVHIAGRALLVKSFARETSERRGGFVPVPAGMNLAQGMAALDQTQAQSQTEAAPRPKGLVAPTVLALRP